MNKFRDLCYCILLAISLIGCNKNRVILNPDFESNNYHYSSFGIDKIEVNDTSTILDITLYNQPGFWVSVSPTIKMKGRITGTDYPLKSMEGLAPDIMIHVDSTGYFPTKLIFDALNPADTLIDLIEDEKLLYKGIRIYEDSSYKFKTRLSGTLTGMGNSWLIVSVSHPFNENKKYIVPVREGKFNYEFYTHEPLLFEVYIGKEYEESSIIKGPAFWSEGGDIRLDFKNGSSKDFTLNGGPLTQELNDFHARRKAFNDAHIKNIPEIKGYYDLQEKEQLYIPEYYSLQRERSGAVEGWIRMRARNAIYQLVSSDSLFTTEGRKAMLTLQDYYQQHGDSILQLQEDYLDRELEHPTFSKLFLLYETIAYSNYDLDRNIHHFVTSYADTFTNSSYHRYIRELADLIAPVVGNHFVNIILPDNNGYDRSLAEIIDGKSTMLIFQSDDVEPQQLKELVSYYKNHATKDFEIVTVFFQSNNDKSKNLLNFSDYPWPTLYDNKINGSRLKYRIGNQKIKTFLIDKKGIISAVDPESDEIKTFLEITK